MISQKFLTFSQNLNFNNFRKKQQNNDKSTQAKKKPRRFLKKCNISGHLLAVWQKFFKKSHLNAHLRDIHKHLRKYGNIKKHLVKMWVHKFKNANLGMISSHNYPLQIQIEKGFDYHSCYFRRLWSPRDGSNLKGRWS